MLKAIGICLLSLGVCGASDDRNAEPAIDTRAGQIEAERTRKAANLQPAVAPPIDRVLQQIKDKEILERISEGVAGWRAKLGGLITGSGFAIGPQYYREDLAHENIVVHSSIRASLRQYYLMEAGISMPKLADNRLFVSIDGVHRGYPHIDYYGPGPDSEKSGRTGYLLEDTSFALRGGVRPVKHLRLGGLASYLFVNVGPGQDLRFAPADQVYSPAVAPGILHQSNFLLGGAFAEYDTRDYPGGPRKGGLYAATFTHYADRSGNLFSFRRMDLEAQRYFHFFNERRVIALRAKTSFTDPQHGNRVPFYLQPQLGGADDLRGFRPFRFYDNNSFVMNGEYRWEVFSGLDMALFLDAGRVFPRWRDISFHDLETSYGFGFRFNVRNSVFLRIDTGFSHEGFQVWFKFSNVF